MSANRTIAFYPISLNDLSRYVEKTPDGIPG
jgi:hypothetical protein